MNRKILIAFLVGAALSMALTLLFNNSIRDAANAIGQMLGADPLTVPDSVATTSDTFVAEADCVDVIQPDTVEIATTPRVYLPKPAPEPAASTPRHSQTPLRAILSGYLFRG